MLSQDQGSVFQIQHELDEHEIHVTGRTWFRVEYEVWILLPAQLTDRNRPTNLIRHLCLVFIVEDKRIL